jgi:GntR family transcriptional repressor for pyruvate dehydrogenase complex
MEAVLVRQTHQVAGGHTGMESDTAFHSLLAHSTKNPLLLKLNESIVDGLRETRERSLHAPGRPARSLVGHRRILDAIRARSPVRARRAMLRHLQEVERNIVRVGAVKTGIPARAGGARTTQAA